MDTIAQLKLGFSPLHKSGWRFVAVSLGAGLLLYWLGFAGLSFVAFFITAFLGLIFRDPKRTVPNAGNEIVAPGDGYVTRIALSSPPHELDLPSEPVWQITIASGVFDSLVQRSCAGRVHRITATPGQGFPSVFGSPQGELEKLFILLNLPNALQVGFQFTAGWLPNQIQNFVQEDEVLVAGQRIAILSPLSRVDVYLPQGFNAQVGVGQRMVAGETVLARVGLAASSHAFTRV